MNMLRFYKVQKHGDPLILEKTKRKKNRLAPTYTNAKLDKADNSLLKAFTTLFTHCVFKRKAKGLLIAFIIMAIPFQCLAENLFLRSDAAGLNNGSDWENAWANFSDVVWGNGPGRLGAGDTLWIAGGVYQDQLIIRSSGTIGSPIMIKRASLKDPECVSTVGWKPEFDSQVIINPEVTAICVDNHRDWIIIDGQVPNGIKVKIPDCNGCMGLDWDYSCNHWTIRYMDFAGPNGGPGAYYFNYTVRGLNLAPPTSSGISRDITISRCKIHGIVDGIFLNNVSEAVIEHCQIYDINSSNSALHCNVLYAAGACNNVEFRFNDVFNYTPEGLFFSTSTTKDNWRVYGNLFHDGPTSSTARVLEVRQGAVTNLRFYNNTLVNLWAGIRVMEGTTLTGDMRNNIMYNVGWTSFGSMTHDYNFSDGDVFSEETHGISNGSNPFTDLDARDYHIIGVVGPRFPRDKGISLGDGFDIDKEGHKRGEDGLWDMGAYERGGPPSSPRNLQITDNCIITPKN